MYGQFPITIIILFFEIDVNNVNLIVFIVIWGFSGCLVFFILFYYFILFLLFIIIMGGFHFVLFSCTPTNIDSTGNNFNALCLRNFLE